MSYCINKYIFCAIFFLSFSACKQKDTEKILGYQMHGIDVSHHQGKINWEVIPDQNIQFVFIKTSEGINFRDSLFYYNYSNAKKAGLKVGAYHFFRPKIDGKKQAINFMAGSNLTAGDILPVLDIEVDDGANHSQILTNLNDYINHIDSCLGVKPILYTYQKFYNKHLASNFGDDLLWVARYSDKIPDLHGEAEWHFWQYGERGKIKGIDSYVDFNVFCCSEKEFLKFIYLGDKLFP